MKCPERPGGFDNGDNWRSTAGFEPNLETRTPKPEGPETEGRGREGGWGGTPVEKIGPKEVKFAAGAGVGL